MRLAVKNSDVKEVLTMNETNLLMYFELDGEFYLIIDWSADDGSMETFQIVGNFLSKPARTNFPIKNYEEAVELHKRERWFCEGEYEFFARNAHKLIIKENK